jgi:hypothetical protein
MPSPGPTAAGLVIAREPGRSRSCRLRTEGVEVYQVARRRSLVSAGGPQRGVLERNPSYDCSY